MRRFAFGVSAAVVVFAFGAGSAAARSDDYTFIVSSGCANACSAYAKITPGNGVLTVELTDTGANPVSAGDILSGIQITTSVSSAAATLSSQAGSLIDVNSNGTTTSVTGSPTHWGASVSGAVISLATVGAPGQGGQPKNLIIGPPGTNGLYSNANGSVGNFDPYINGTGTFTLVDSSILPSTSITSVSFEFGTTPDVILKGINTPEPGSLAVLAAALAGLAVPVVRRHRRSKAN